MNKGEAYGRCLCGAVKFSFPFPTKWVAHCHCTMCRRAHGAAFVTWVGAPAEACTIADPENLLRWYRSSPEAERGFCSRCGGSLFFRSEQHAELHIARANFAGRISIASRKRNVSISTLTLAGRHQRCIAEEECPRRVSR